jgi:NAD(P)-dependent dehydrogenase (short-subunit alcohol dehydrogenase family)
MSSFGFESTTEDVLQGVDLTGKQVLVTGASAGLGVETTRALAAHGAAVTMAVRDLEKATPVMEAILDEVPGAQLDLRYVDLADLDTVGPFCDGVLEDHPVIDILIANAGIMACPQGATKQGFELQFGTNHLGHFKLVTRLLPALLAAGQSRVVILSSSGHRFSDVDLDDWNFERTPYDAWMSYGRAKTANVLFAVALDDRYQDQGLRAFAVHPGGIQTELGRHLTDETLGVMIERTKNMTTPMVWKTVPQGAATSVWAATSPDLDGRGAIFLEDCHIAEVVTDPNQMGGVRDYALDHEKAAALWDLSERLVANA